MDEALFLILEWDDWNETNQYPLLINDHLDWNNDDDDPYTCNEDYIWDDALAWEPTLSPITFLDWMHKETEEILSHLAQEHTNLDIQNVKNNMEMHANLFPSPSHSALLSPFFLASGPSSKWIISSSSKKHSGVTNQPTFFNYHGKNIFATPTMAWNNFEGLNVRQIWRPGVKNMRYLWRPWVNAPFKIPIMKAIS